MESLTKGRKLQFVEKLSIGDYLKDVQKSILETTWQQKSALEWGIEAWVSLV